MFELNKVLWTTSDWLKQINQAEKISYYKFPENLNDK